MGNLNTNQTRAVAAILEHPTLEAAAESTGVTSRTLRNWLKEDDFARALDDAQMQMLQSHLGRLSGLLQKSAAVYEQLLNSDEDAIRLRSADSINRMFDMLTARRLAVREMNEFEERLKALEAAYNGQT